MFWIVGPPEAFPKHQTGLGVIMSVAEAPIATNAARIESRSLDEYARVDALTVWPDSGLASIAA
ncbi:MULTISPECIES: hypothetical protein [Actinomadura]|uniref:Uncharacterized protein n=1 Tax=Actinomadura citrea TaxID=46158 RepID=A0A7Y9GEW2_9ACTN|nr:hypothetical protein [Actinomadura citrea]NYE15244.1 hypothetical protein [Actinomadura citrea]GGT94412.1 hypothetical protein GCM10010177_62000 [Actinomadura citrea]